VGYAETLLLYDPLLFVLGTAGAVLLARRTQWLLLAFLLCYPAAHLVLLLAYHSRDRFLLPLLPVLAILASPCIAYIFRMSTAQHRIGAAVAAVAVLFQLGSVVHWDLLASRADTETLGREWIKTHIPSGSRVLALGVDMDLPESRASAAEAQSLGVKLTLKQQALLAGEVPEPHPAFVVAYFDQQPTQLSPHRAEYLVVNEVDPARVPSEIQTLAARARLVQEILPGPVSRVDSAGVGNDVSYWSTRNLERLGPLVRIYQLEQVAAAD
jgi:hypothetical protein